MIARRLLRNPLAMVGLVIVVIAAAIALLAPLVAPFPFDQVNFKAPLQPPSGTHIFGTDSIGRDQLSRAIYACGRPSRSGCCRWCFRCRSASR